VGYSASYIVFLVEYVVPRSTTGDRDRK